jgi:NitT/TauT family transport system permease protein
MAGRAFSGFPLPPFTTVAGTVVEMIRNGSLVGPLVASLGSLALGLPAAAAAGILAGLLTARSHIVAHLVDVYFDALMAAPALIYVPVLFTLFGVTRASQVAVVFTYAFFVIAATTREAIQAADSRLIDMACAFGASERQIFWTVALPASRPLVLAGLHLGATRAVKGMVVGEMIIALSGLGAMLKAYGSRFDIQGILAILMVIALVSVGTNALVGAIGRRMLGSRFEPPTS